MTRLLLQLCVLVACFYGAQALSRACTSKPADIIFVLDGSGSEGHANFNKELQFAANITSHFHIAHTKTRVSLVTFGTAVKNEFYLNNNFSKAELLSHITQAAYPNGETNTQKALNFVRIHTLQTSNGGGRNVSKLVIVLTDGKSSNPVSLTHAANALKSDPHVTVFAVGIGHRVDKSELGEIASDPSHVFHVNTFNDLSALHINVTHTACRVCSRSLSDVCFVLDGSGSEGAINFNKQLLFVNTLINSMSFHKGANSRVCLVTFGNKANLEIPLTNGMTKPALMNNVLKVPYSNGETMTHKGLNVAHTQLNNNVHSSKLAIVLTDGRSNDPDLTKQAANSLHSDGIETIAVGIGRHVDQNELNNIASDNSQVFTVGSFDQLKDIHQNVVNRMCTHARHTHNPTSTTITTRHHRHHTTAKLTTRVQTTVKSTTQSTTTSSTTSTTTVRTLAPTTIGCHQKPADVVFVIDSSEIQGIDNFNAAVGFAHDFAANISKEIKDVKFGSVTFSTNVRNDFFLNKFNSRSDAVHAISNIQYIGEGSNTPEALKFVRTQSLQPVNGARADSTKIVVIITNGYSGESQKVQNEADLLQKQAKVFAVSIGTPDDRAKIDALTSNHHADVSSNSLPLLQSIKSELADPSCMSSFVG